MTGALEGNRLLRRPCPLGERSPGLPSALRFVNGRVGVDHHRDPTRLRPTFSQTIVWRHAKVQQETRRTCISCREIACPRCILLWRATAGKPGVLCHSPPECPVLCAGASPRSGGHTSCTHRPSARSRTS